VLRRAGAGVGFRTTGAQSTACVYSYARPDR